MHKTTPSPVGNTLVRLADIDLDIRLRAFNHLLQHNQISEDEAFELLDKAILSPEDRSARIAA